MISNEVTARSILHHLSTPALLSTPANDGNTGRTISFSNMSLALDHEASKVAADRTVKLFGKWEATE